MHVPPTDSSVVSSSAVTDTIVTAVSAVPRVAYGRRGPAMCAEVCANVEIPFLRNSIVFLPKSMRHSMLSPSLKPSCEPDAGRTEPPPKSLTSPSQHMAIPNWQRAALGPELSVTSGLATPTHVYMCDRLTVHCQEQMPSPSKSWIPSATPHESPDVRWAVRPPSETTTSGPRVASFQKGFGSGTVASSARCTSRSPDWFTWLSQPLDVRSLVVPCRLTVVSRTSTVSPTSTSPHSVDVNSADVRSAHGRSTAYLPRSPSFAVVPPTPAVPRVSRSDFVSPPEASGWSSSFGARRHARSFAENDTRQEYSARVFASNASMLVLEGTAVGCCAIAAMEVKHSPKVPSPCPSVLDSQTAFSSRARSMRNVGESPSWRIGCDSTRESKSGMAAATRAAGGGPIPTTCCSPPRTNTCGQTLTSTVLMSLGSFAAGVAATALTIASMNISAHRGSSRIRLRTTRTTFFCRTSVRLAAGSGRGPIRWK